MLKAAVIALASLVFIAPAAGGDPPANQIVLEYVCHDEGYTQITRTVGGKSTKHAVDGVCGDDVVYIEINEDDPPSDTLMFYRCQPGFGTYYETWANGQCTGYGYINMECDEFMEWWEG